MSDEFYRGRRLSKVDLATYIKDHTDVLVGNALLRLLKRIEQLEAE